MASSVAVKSAQVKRLAVAYGLALPFCSTLYIRIAELRLGE